MLEQKPKYAGFEGLILFLDTLKKNKIQFTLEYDRPGAILVCAALVGVRLEVEVFTDKFEFSYFKGDESVDVDVVALETLIDENWS